MGDFGIQARPYSLHSLGLILPAPRARNRIPAGIWPGAFAAGGIEIWEMQAAHRGWQIRGERVTGSGYYADSAPVGITHAQHLRQLFLSSRIATGSHQLGVTVVAKIARPAATGAAPNTSLPATTPV